jgi:hypothetical protein
VIKTASFLPTSSAQLLLFSPTPIHQGKCTILATNAKGSGNELCNEIPTEGARSTKWIGELFVFPESLAKTQHVKQKQGCHVKLEQLTKTNNTNTHEGHDSADCIVIWWRSHTNHVNRGTSRHISISDTTIIGERSATINQSNAARGRIHAFLDNQTLAENRNHNDHQKQKGWFHHGRPPPIFHKCCKLCRFPVQASR